VAGPEESETQNSFTIMTTATGHPRLIFLVLMSSGNFVTCNGAADVDFSTRLTAMAY
jgi:hypothetical protein